MIVVILICNIKNSVRSKNKKYREFHSRKCSREKSNEDIFNFLLLSSDPIISSMRKLPKKKFHTLPEQGMNLILYDDCGDTNNDVDNCSNGFGKDDTDVDDEC